MKMDARSLALIILSRFQANTTKIDQIISSTFSQFNVHNQIKGRARVIVNEVVRFRDRLDLMIEYASERKKIHIKNKTINILRIGFYELVMDDKVPDYAAVNSAVDIADKELNRKGKGFVNAVLRKMIFLIDNDSNWYKSLEKKSAWNSIPNWLQERWRSNYEESKFIKMVNYFNTPPQNFVRVDDSKSTVLDVEKALKNQGISCDIFSSRFVRIFEGYTKLLKTGLFQDGKISIQNPASASVVDCLGAGLNDSVLDVCAAPGTKSLYLANIVGENGKIFASDIDRMRIIKAKADIKRHRKYNIIWEQKDASKAEYEMSNYILIDAPCTGTGVIGRKPDIRWRRKSSDIKLMSKIQLKILNNCSKFLNESGTLVYATCSMEPEENWGVVEEFLKSNKDFFIDTIPPTVPKTWIDKRGALSTIPFEHGVDGLFAAKMVRA